MIQQFFNSEVFTITFVIALYLLNYKLYRLAGTTLLHPVLLTIIELIVLLMYLDVPYDTFKSGSRMIHFMLGPSVVSLGYILHQQVAHLKGNVISIMVAITVGAMIGIGSIIGIGQLLGAHQTLIASLAPKSVTTPIAMELSGNTGGIPGLTAVIVVCAGILMGIKSPVAKGLAMGASSHGIGTAAAIQMGAIEGALSGLAIGIMGLITALLLPLFARWLG